MKSRAKVTDFQELLDIDHVKPQGEIDRLVCRASWEFKGQIDDLYMAVGCLVVGRLIGWRIIRLTLTPSNYAKYQRILAQGLDEPGQFHFKDWMRDEDKLSYKSIGLILADGVADFWAVARGYVASLPLPRRREVADKGGLDELASDVLI